ncbi:hypothetical protein AB0333_16435 [Citricoccus sp. NPDC079358]|uniref:hypothetical protein n=1 Tax=Citricoccus sp. NPDC079358 TaxID=3154653 RepID=UPI00344B5D13
MPQLNFATIIALYSPGLIALIGLSAAWGSPSVHDQQRRCGREPAPPGLPE